MNKYLSIKLTHFTEQIFKYQLNTLCRDYAKRKKSQIQKTIFCISFIWNVQKKNYRARKHMSGFLELSKTANGNEVILWNNVFWNWIVMIAQVYKFIKNHLSFNKRRATREVLCINYTSVKLEKKKKIL